MSEQMQQEQDLTRVEGQPVSERRPTAASNRPARMFRTEEQLRNVVSMLCHFVWHRQVRPGDHLWSIPVDYERDFDCILSDAISELVEWRQAADAVDPSAADTGTPSTRDKEDDNQPPSEVSRHA